MRGAAGQALIYIYGQPTESEAMAGKVLTMDGARPIAFNVGRLPELLKERE